VDNGRRGVFGVRIGLPGIQERGVKAVTSREYILAIGNFFCFVALFSKGDHSIIVAINAAVAFGFLLRAIDK
jgi:hypothetical protein